MKNIYKKSKDILHGGKADYKNPYDFNKNQLRKGIKTEHEHTDSEQIAKEIAMDHLQEDPKYYDHLQEMEESYKEGSFSGYMGLEDFTRISKMANKSPAVGDEDKLAQKIIKGIKGSKGFWSDVLKAVVGGTTTAFTIKGIDAAISKPKPKQQHFHIYLDPTAIPDEGDTDTFAADRGLQTAINNMGAKESSWEDYIETIGDGVVDSTNKSINDIVKLKKKLFKPKPVPGQLESVDPYIF